LFGFGAVSLLKIVHVVRQFPPAIGGIEESVLNLCKLLIARHGLAIEVVTLNRCFRSPERTLVAHESVHGIPVTRISYLGSRRYPFAPGVLRHLHGADLVHVHAIDFFFDFLALTKPFHGKKLIASTHGGFFHTNFVASLKQIYFATVTRLSCAAYERICASSESDANLFRRIAGDKVITIENGVDLAKLAGCASPVRRRTLLYFGRIATHKRIDLLFPILRRLRTAMGDWRLIVAGSEWDVTFATLEAAARAQGVADAVRFVRDPSRDDLAKLASEASYFSAPSAHEGFGITAVEAMSAGLIPVLSRIPSFTRFVERAGAGLLIDPLDADDAAQLILALDSRVGKDLSAERLKLMGAAQSYDWASVSDRFAEQYAQALHQPGPATSKLAGGSTPRA
jgi:alpha-1,3-mannosyltransferase